MLAATLRVDPEGARPRARPVRLSPMDMKASAPVNPDYAAVAPCEPVTPSQPTALWEGRVHREPQVPGFRITRSVQKKGV